MRLYLNLHAIVAIEYQTGFTWECFSHDTEVQILKQKDT